MSGSDRVPPDSAARLPREGMRVDPSGPRPTVQDQRRGYLVAAIQRQAGGTGEEASKWLADYERSLLSHAALSPPVGGEQDNEWSLKEIASEVRAACQKWYAEGDKRDETITSRLDHLFDGLAASALPRAPGAPAEPSDEMIHAAIEAAQGFDKFGTGYSFGVERMRVALRAALAAAAPAPAPRGEDEATDVV